jgi:hypothetical protein
VNPSPAAQPKHPSTRGLIQLFALLLALLCTLPSTLSAQDQDQGRLVFKAGIEHDSNTRRQIGSETLPDQALRLFAKLSQQVTLGTLALLDTRLLFGAKAHRDIPDEDAFVSSAQIALKSPLWTTDSAALALLCSADFADRSERSSQRDYTRASAIAGLGAQWWRLSASIMGGGHAFIYKPQLEANHAGWMLHSSVALALLDELELGVSYALIDRAFDSMRFVDVESIITTDEHTKRRDSLHAVRASLSYKHGFIASAAYSLQLNQSNSVGPGLVRHGVDLLWTQEVFWTIMLSAKLRLLRTHYDDPVRIDQTLAIDDADRNELGITLSIPLFSTLQLELGYAFFGEALGSQADFSRHLAYLGFEFGTEQR